MFKKLVLVALVVCPAFALADEPEKNLPDRAALAKTVTVSAGQLAALKLGVYFAAAHVIDAPVLVDFDEKDNLIGITIIGERDTVEGAKETVERVVKSVGTLSEVFRRHNDVALNDRTVRYVYFSKKKPGEPLLQRSDGLYVSR